MVQHRPALGLRCRWTGPGPLLCGLEDRQADQVEILLRASAAARLLHPGHRGRPRQRGRHHGSVGARGAPVQIRLRHRLQLLAAARRRRTAFRRRTFIGPDELPQDRRPRRGRDQVRRHHPPRRQDGGGRRRSSGYRGLYRLEGEGRAEGRRPRHRLQAQSAPPQGGAESLRQLRRKWRRLLRSREEPCSAPRNQARPPRHGRRRHDQARHPVRPARLQGNRFSDLRHRLGFGSLSHRIRPELQQFGIAEGRFPARGRDRWRLESDRPHQQEDHQDPEGPRPLGKNRPRRLGVGRSRPALQHHHERLAHLQGVRRNPRLQSVLGIHVPGRYRLQPGLGQSDHLLQHHDQAVRYRCLRASLPALDRGARNLGDDGAVPLQGDCGIVLRIPHAGAGLCQYRRPLDDHGSVLQLQGRPRAVRRPDRGHDRHQLRHVGGNGQGARPLPRLQEERRAHAAGDPQPSPRRAW